MGHIEWGRLPDLPAWNAVLAELASPHANALAVARGTVEAANDRLRSLQGDPSVTYCFWLLLRLAAAARGPDFRSALQDLQIGLDRDDTALSLIARVADQARTTLRRYPQSGPFGEMAALSLRRALTETVGTEGRSLFDSSIEDTERAFRHFSTGAQFGKLATRFFGDFYARTLQFYVDRELANVVGSPGLPTLAAAERFHAELDLHARRSAHILDRFAIEWYLKKRWERQEQIGLDDAQAFVVGAMRKLRKELAQAAP